MTTVVQTPRQYRIAGLLRTLAPIAARGVDDNMAVFIYERTRSEAASASVPTPQ